MATIPSLAPLPSRVNRPETLDDDTERLFENLDAYGVAVEAAANQAVAASEAGANGYSFGFLAGTAQGDPGSGAVRINNANVLAATALYVSSTASTGAAIGALFDTFDDSTASIKGVLRVVRSSDPSRWVLYNLLSVLTTDSTYRTFMVSAIASSSASPFNAGESLALQYSQNGDRGDRGEPGPATSDAVRAELWALLLAM